MPIKSKNVFIVKCDREIFERIFAKKRNAEIINRQEIFQKLTNKDIHKSPPSEEIVDFHVMKKLNFFRDCRRTEFIFYLFDRDDLNLEFIKTIKSIIGNSFVPVYFHLLTNSSIVDEVSNTFHSVQKIEHD